MPEVLCDIGDATVDVESKRAREMVKGKGGAVRDAFDVAAFTASAIDCRDFLMEQM